MKKYIYLDLLHLSLVLSLLRFCPTIYRGVSWYDEPYGQEVYFGDSIAYTQARFHNLNNHEVNGFVHPKNIDNAIERSLFLRDVNSIYRRPDWNCNSQRRETNTFAYILNELRPHAGLNAGQENSESEQSGSQGQTPTTELTQADMDLIEALWKQDIDLGVPEETHDDTEKLHEAGFNSSTSNSSFHNYLKGQNYGIGSETEGRTEHAITSSTNNAAALVPNQYASVAVDETLSLFEPERLNIPDVPTDMMLTNDMSVTQAIEEPTTESFMFNSQDSYLSNVDQNQSLLDQLHELQQMVSDAHIDPYSENFGPSLQAYSDLDPNYNSTENNTAVLEALLQNTTLVLPFDESPLNSSFQLSGEFVMEHDTSINSLLSFLSNDSDPNPVGAVGGNDHNDVSPDLSVANLTVDNTFISQLMNEDSMNFSEFCNLPLNTTLQTSWPASTSNDSAVSGMGSDWSDSCSGESRSSESSVLDYTSTSFHIDSDSEGPTSYKRNDCKDNIQKNIPNSLGKFNLFGKQGGQEIQHTAVKNRLVSKPPNPDEYKEPSTAESFNNLPRFAFIHNHTYHHGDSATGKESLEVLSDEKKPQTRVSVRGTRDDKRLLGTNLPLTVKEIVELPVEQFNERLKQLHLSDEHLSLIRDIRRRGKNKVAAQTCRKRKIHQISDLQTVVEDLDRKRVLAYENMEKAIAHRDMLKQKYQRLHQFIFPGCDPPDPIPPSYFRDSVPSTSFPLNSNSTSGNDTEPKKRGKHKGANKN